MNKKLILVVAIMLFVGIGLVAFQGYSAATKQIEKQKASIYDATGESLSGATYSDAVTWQVLGEKQCLGLNGKGQALIGVAYRKSFSFSRGCKILDGDLPNATTSNILDADRFWFGGLVGSQCYSVTTDNTGNHNGVFLEKDIKDKNTCLVN